jgi:hypothetical protein
MRVAAGARALPPRLGPPPSGGRPRRPHAARPTPMPATHRLDLTRIALKPRLGALRPLRRRRRLALQALRPVCGGAHLKPQLRRRLALVRQLAQRRRERAHLRLARLQRLQQRCGRSRQARHTVTRATAAVRRRTPHDRAPCSQQGLAPPPTTCRPQPPAAPNHLPPLPHCAPPRRAPPPAAPAARRLRRHRAPRRCAPPPPAASPAAGRRVRHTGAVTTSCTAEAQLRPPPLLAPRSPCAHLVLLLLLLAEHLRLEPQQLAAEPLAFRLARGRRIALRRQLLLGRPGTRPQPPQLLFCTCGSVGRRGAGAGRGRQGGLRVRQAAPQRAHLGHRCRRRGLRRVALRPRRLQLRAQPPRLQLATRRLCRGPGRSSTRGLQLAAEARRLGPGGRRLGARAVVEAAGGGRTRVGMYRYVPYCTDATRLPCGDGEWRRPRASACTMPSRPPLHTSHAAAAPQRRQRRLPQPPPAEAPLLGLKPPPLPSRPQLADAPPPPAAPAAHE